MAYKTVTRTFGDMQGFGRIFGQVLNRDIKNVRIPIGLEAGKGEIYIHDNFWGNYFIADVELPLSDEHLNDVCNNIPKSITTCYSTNAPKLVIKRTIPFDSKSVTYEVVASQSEERKLPIAVSMLLPEMLREPDHVVDGYHYYAASGEEKERMYAMAMAILDDSIRRHHVFRRAEKYNDRCVTKVCFEPRKVPEDEAARIMREMLTDTEGESEASLRYKRKSIGRTMIAYDMGITPKRAKGFLTGRNCFERDGAEAFSELMGAMALAIPDDLEITMDEKYTSRAGRAAADFFRKIGRGLYVPVGYLLAPVVGVMDKVEEQRRRRDALVEEWLREKVKVPPNTEGYNKSCFVIINPACELDVRRGKDLGSPGDSLSIVEPAKVGDEENTQNQPG